MFIETFAGGSGRSALISDDRVPGGGREPIPGSVVHNTGCVCMGCCGFDVNKLPGSIDPGSLLFKAPTLDDHLRAEFYG